MYVTTIFKDRERRRETRKTGEGTGFFPNARFKKVTKNPIYQSDF